MKQTVIISFIVVMLASLAFGSCHKPHEDDITIAETTNMQ